MPLRPYRSVVAGEAHTCALAASGEAECWGSDSHGQSSPPADVTFLQISAGGNTTCGLQVGRSLVCWGADVNAPSIHAADAGPLSYVTHYGFSRHMSEEGKEGLRTT